MTDKEWNPIETAPKDRNHILLFRPEMQFIGYWGGASYGWRINAPRLPALWPPPTHWMLLPKCLKIQRSPIHEF